MTAAAAPIRDSRFLQPAHALLTSYARLHRDRRNIQTHLVGVPLNVLAFGLLLARPQFGLGPLALSPAWAGFALAAAWYLTRGSVRIGLAVTALVGGLLLAAHQVHAAAPVPGLVIGLVLLALGTALQLAGHYYEGHRPATLTDPVHMLVGPMFVSVQLLALFGFLRPVALEIDRRAGPVHVRDLAHPSGHG